MWIAIGPSGIDRFVGGGCLRRALAVQNYIYCVTTNTSYVMRATFPVISICKHIRKIAQSDSYVLSPLGKLGCWWTDFHEILFECFSKICPERSDLKSDDNNVYFT